MLDISQVQRFGRTFEGGLTPTSKELPIGDDEVLVATFVPTGQGHAVAGIISGEYYDVFLECLNKKEIIFCELYILERKNVEKCRVMNITYADQLLWALGIENPLLTAH